MNEFALIETFSGNKLFSKRTYPLNEYYDGSCTELDDADFVVDNNITKMIISIPYFNQKSICFFNGSPIGYKYVDITGNSIEKVEFHYKDDIINNLEISFSVSDIICLELCCKIDDSFCTETYGRIISSEYQPKIKGGIINGSEMQILFEYHAETKTSEKTYNFSKDVFSPDTDKFFISISDGLNDEILK